MLAYAHDLLNSDYAGHRLTFQLFAQSPPFSHLLAVYNNYDFGPAVRADGEVRRARGTRCVPEGGPGVTELDHRRRAPPDPPVQHRRHLP